MPIGRGQGKVELLRRQETLMYRDMIGAVQVARKNVAAEIAKAARNPQAVAAARAREDLYSRVGGVYRMLGKELDAIAKESTANAAFDWHKEALKDVKDMSGKVSSSVVKFDRSRLKNYWEIISPDNTKNLAGVFTTKMAQDDIRALRQSFLDTWRQAELEGLTLNERQKLLQEKWDNISGNLASDRFIDASGKQWTNATYLQMLTRTTSARVARDSYFDTMIKNGNGLAQIENVDGEACEICQAWDGVIVSIAGNNDKFPSYQDALNAGMFHPNCRCMAEGVDEDLDAAEIAKQEETETPEIVPDEYESAAEYKRRVTEAIADYSRDFEVSTPETTAKPKESSVK
jgi:hypothetical protein